VFLAAIGGRGFADLRSGELSVVWLQGSGGRRVSVAIFELKSRMKVQPRRCCWRWISASAASPALALDLRLTAAR
jgi:hypothetical protein